MENLEANILLVWKAGVVASTGVVVGVILLCKVVVIVLGVVPLVF